MQPKPGPQPEPGGSLYPANPFPIQADPVAALVRSLSDAIERAQKAEIECARLRSALETEKSITTNLQAELAELRKPAGPKKARRRK